MGNRWTDECADESLIAQRTVFGQNHWRNSATVQVLFSPMMLVSLCSPAHWAWVEHYARLAATQVSNLSGQALPIAKQGWRAGVRHSPCQTRRTVGSVRDPSRHRFVEIFTPVAFTSLSNDLPIMMSPITIKLVLNCLWYRNASVSTNMFSDCRNLIALKPINLRWIMATKCASSETVQIWVVRLPWQAPAGRCLTFVWGSRAAGTSKTDNGDTSPVPKWYVTAKIDIYITSPSVTLWKTVQHRQDYLSRWLITFRT